MILSQENCLFDAHRESTYDGEGSRVTVLRFWAWGRLSLYGKPLFWFLMLVSMSLGKEVCCDHTHMDDDGSFLSAAFGIGARGGTIF